MERLNASVTDMRVCIMDEYGRVVALRTDQRRLCMAVQEGEALALVAAMEFVISSGYNAVTFETDCKCVVHKIRVLSFIRVKLQTPQETVS